MSISERRLICGYSILAACVVAGCFARGEDETKKSGFFSRITDLVRKKEEPPPPAPVEKPKSEAGPKTATSTKSKAGDEPVKPKTTASQTRKKTTPKPEVKEPAKDTKAGSPKTEVAKKKETPSAPKKVEPAVPAKNAGPESKPAAVADKTKTDAAKPAADSDKDKAADDKKAPASASSAVAKASTPAPSADSISVDPPGRPMGGFSPGDDRAVDVTASTRVGSVTSSASTKLTEPPASAGIINPLPPGKNGGWEIVKHDGRDYVTGDSILNFYRVAGLSTYKFTSPHVWFRGTNLSIKAQVGSMELLINNVKFILSYPVTGIGGKALFSRLDLCKLIDPVLRPNYIADADPFDTVVIDAGHGGHDSGAKGVYGYEKDFALKMAFAVKASLEKRGFKVVMTRSTDVFISRTGRVAIANKTPNSIFISLHFNSAGATATGIETFALTPQNASASLERGGGYNASNLTGNRQDSENIALATAVHARVVSTYKLIDRGIKRAQWTVLTGCNRPGILFEGGFVTNGTECRFIASDTYRRALAETIGDAVVNYRKALQPPNMVRRSSSPYAR